MSKIKELIENAKNFLEHQSIGRAAQLRCVIEEYESLSQPTINEGYDLKTLEHIKLIFDIHSDMSSSTNGYRSLCDLIDKIKSNPQLSQPKGMTKSKVGREKK